MNMELPILKNALMVLMSWLLLITTIIAVSATPNNTGLNPHKSISPAYTYDDFQSSIRVLGIGDDRINRVVPRKEIGAKSENTPFNLEEPLGGDFQMLS